jgi:hypothetical protein
MGFTSCAPARAGHKHPASSNFFIIPGFGVGKVTRFSGMHEKEELHSGNKK